MKKTIIDKHAKRWRADVRTIQRWIADGAPLDDNKKMWSWLAGRKNIPQGTAALLSAKRKRSAITPAVAAIGKIGAGAALERLEKAEAEAFARFTDAVNAGDAAAIRFTRVTWLHIGENLRKYHSQVDDVDRPGGETIRRGDCELYLRGVSHWLNGAFRVMPDELHKLLRLGTLPAQGELHTLFSRIFIAALASGMEYRCKATIPRWVYEALTSSSPFRVPADCVEADKVLYDALVSKLNEIAVKSIVKPEGGQ